MARRVEYTTKVLTHGFMGRHKEEVNRPDLDKLLNEMGKDGWVLGHVFFDQELLHEKDGHLLIFRRDAE